MTVPRQVTLQHVDYNPLHSGYTMAMMPFNTSAITEGQLFKNDDGKCVKNGTSVDLKGDGAFEITATVTMTAEALKNATTNSTMDFYVHSSNKGEALRLGILAGDPGVAYVDRRFAGSDWANGNQFFTDRFSGQLQALYTEANKTTSDREWSFKILVDRTITEYFVNEGVQSATILHFWNNESKPARLEVRMGDEHVKVSKLSVKALKSTW